MPGPYEHELPEDYAAAAERAEVRAERYEPDMDARRYVDDVTPEQLAIWVAQVREQMGWYERGKVAKAGSPMLVKQAS